MPRQQAKQRLIANERKLAAPRKPVGFLDDNKIHVVLDTNIIIYALEAKFKGVNSSETEKDCLSITDLWEKGLITVGMNHYLMNEYTEIANKKITEGKVLSSDVNKLLNLAQNARYFRVLVDQKKVSRHKNDDILFDGLSADYLVSENWKHVRQDKLISQSAYISIIRPHELVVKLKNSGIIF